MLKRIQILVLLFFVAGITYGKVPTGIDSQRLKPSLGLKGMIVTDNSEVLDPMNFGLMLYFHYDKAPFNLEAGDKEEVLVNNVIYSDIIFTISLFKNFELGVDLPLSIFSDGKDSEGNPFDGFKIGDLRAGVRYVLKFDKLGVGFKLNGYFPTGDVKTFNSSDDFVIQPGVLVDYKVSEKLLVAFNMSYLYRVNKAVELASVRIGDEISYKLGVKYVLNEKLEIFSELFGAFQAKAPFDQKEETPLELLLAANYYIDNFRITGGVAGGLVSGVGTPLFRVLLGVGYVQRDPDYDKDGILNGDDECPNKAEDKDGFEDYDGCPDPDNDEDGVLDGDDKCPLKAEDVDKFEDEDGCPDPDNDNDGILDDDDKCPLDPESMNGFEDEDGCPELDADNDGIYDSKDKCPKEAEDKDNFEDEDGCPDPDNDKDGVLDTKDKCPLVPEDVDKFEDEDGCPDPDNDQDGFLDNKDKCPNEAEIYNGVKDDDGCPDKGVELVKVDKTTNKIRIMKKVFFKTASHKIKKKSYKLLDIVASTLKAYPGIKHVEVQGHTDDRGNDKYNKKLSDRRANSVMKYLIKKGIDPSRLTAHGYGEEQPMQDNFGQLLKDSKNRKIKWKKRKAIKKELKKARSDNRRVEFKILDEK